MKRQPFFIAGLIIFTAAQLLAQTAESQYFSVEGNLDKRKLPAQEGLSPQELLARSVRAQKKAAAGNQKGHTLFMEFLRLEQEPNSWQAVFSVDPKPERLAVRLAPPELAEVGELEEPLVEDWAQSSAGQTANREFYAPLNGIQIQFDNGAALAGIADAFGGFAQTGAAKVLVSYDIEGVSYAFEADFGDFGDRVWALTQFAAADSLYIFNRNRRYLRFGGRPPAKEANAFASEASGSGEQEEEGRRQEAAP